MNVLMLGVGDDGLNDRTSEPVRRLSEYARRAGGRIDLIVDALKPGADEFGPLTVRRTGVKRIGYAPAAYTLAREAARVHPPDLIASQDPFATALVGHFLRRSLGRPLLIQNHSCFLFNRHWIAERPVTFRGLHLLARFLLPRADAWRVVNTRERELYVRRLGLPAGKVRVLPVPCDIALFSGSRLADSTARARERLGFAADARMILWAGRPVRFKRLPLLFSAFAEIRVRFPGARLVVAGRKELAQEDLDRAAKRAGLGGSLVWTGALALQDLAGMYGAADVFLYPSIYEGFGRVLVEAGAAGLPVVATRTAGAEDIVADGETGLLAPVEDARALAQNACGLLADVEKHSRMGSAARTRILSRFDPDRLFDGIVAQWRDVAAAGVSR
ncbi:MAG: glycosyltransferase family 4 protein [Anaerolineales bacterium]|nr:glycosyltransferase family 4 protein [Anaerolineales bacterium]